MQLVNEWDGEGGEMEDEGHLKAFSHHHKLLKRLWEFI